MSLEQQRQDLFEAFQARFGLAESAADAPPDTKVLSSCEHVAYNSIDVFIDRAGTEDAAARLLAQIKEKPLSSAAWSEHELHPKPDEFGDEGTVNFIFTMDLLNFSFWSDRVQPDQRFCVEYKTKRYTGYWSLVAALRRALDDDIPITTPDFWQSEDECDEELLKHVFRSETSEQIPLLKERLEVLREAGTRLYERFDCSPMNLIKKADKSAARLVNLLHDNFPRFRDVTRWEDEKVRFLKRAQILVADVWACFQGQGPGQFDDIDVLTAFPDYRLPQMLYSLGCISFSPPLESRIRQKREIEPGHSWEVQLRGCTVWAVELLKREIKRQAQSEEGIEATRIENLNPILLDYYLYDAAKALEAADEEPIPHHRTRSIWY